MRKKMTSRFSARAFTLVEVMVAMLISMLLLGGIITLLVNSRRTYSLQEEISQLQENANFAMELLTRDLRMASYYGCASVLPANQTLLPFDVALEGVDIPAAGCANLKWQPSGEDLTIDPLQCRPETDALVLRYMEDAGRELLNDVCPGCLSFPIDMAPGPTGLDQNESVIISDCAAGDIFTITNNDVDATGTVQFGTSLSKEYHGRNAGGPVPYGGVARVSRLVSQSYSVRMDNTGDGPVSTLYLDEQRGAGAQPLIPGVENMQVYFGEDTGNDGAPDTYVNAQGVTSWQNVVNLRIGLLMRSTQELASLALDTQNYDLFTGAPGCAPPDGERCINPEDLRVRREVYTTVIQLRNR
jgi:type IV pilus assembly protein PilW